MIFSFKGLNVSFCNSGRGNTLAACSKREQYRNQPRENRIKAPNYETEESASMRQ